MLWYTNNLIVKFKKTDMDSQIVGALIGAVGIIIAAIIGVWGKSKAKEANEMSKKADEVERQFGNVSKHLQDESIRRYGFRASSMVSKAEIIDLQGTIKLTRSIHGVQITGADVSLAAIPGIVWVEHPEGKITQFPDLVGQPNFPKHVALTRERCGGKQCDFKVNVAGGLAQGDPPLDYTFQTVYSKGVCMTKEEASEAYGNDVFKMEYHSCDVDIPMGALELEVVFPQGYVVETFAGAFLGKPEYMHNPELKRVQPSFARHSQGAHLRIEEPLFGLRYLIYWMPPPQKEVEQLRQKG